MKTTTLKEIKQDQTNGKIDCVHRTGRRNNAKIATLPKLIYQFIAIFIKVPPSCPSAEVEKTN